MFTLFFVSTSRAAPVEEHPRPNDGLNESYDSDGSIVILDDHELTFEAQSATNDEPIDFCSAEAEAGLPVSDADREVLQQLLSEQPEQQPQIDVRPWPIASRIKHSLCIEFGYLLLISSLLFLVGVLVHRDLQNGQLLKHMRQSVGHAQFMERSMHTRWEICDTQYTEAKSQIAELEKAPKCTTVPAEPAVQAEDEATSGHAIAYAQSRPDHVQNADNDRHRGRKVEGKAVWLGAGDEPEPAVKPPKAQIVEEQSWDLEECNDQKDPLCRLRRMINSDGDDVAAPMDHLSANGRKQDADHCDGDRFVRDFGAEVARKILDDSDCDEFSKLDSHFVSVGNFVMQQRQPRTHEQIHHNEELDQLEKMKRHIKHRDNKDGKRKKRDGHKKKADKAKKWQEEEESMDEKHRKYYDDANFIQRVQTIHRQLN